MVNWRRPEIFSWNIHELWTVEWPLYAPHVLRWWDTVIHPRDKYKRWWPMEVLHVTTNLLTEGLREFAYTLSHLLIIWVVWEIVT